MTSSPSSSTPASDAATPEGRPVFALQRVYLRDCSLEAPHVPEIFLENQEPRLEFQIDTSDRELSETLVEVSIRCTVTCRIGDRVAFLVEATQAGIFEISGVDSDQRMLIRGISCPSIIYPYLRSNLADIVQRGSFPAFHLAEINWESFFNQKMTHIAEKQVQEARKDASHSSDSGLILPS